MFPPSFIDRSFSHNNTHHITTVHAPFMYYAKLVLLFLSPFVIVILCAAAFCCSSTSLNFVRWQADCHICLLDTSRFERILKRTCSRTVLPWLWDIYITGHYSHACHDACHDSLTDRTTYNDFRIEMHDVHVDFSWLLSHSSSFHYPCSTKKDSSPKKFQSTPMLHYEVVAMSP